MRKNAFPFFLIMKRLLLSPGLIAFLVSIPLMCLLLSTISVRDPGVLKIAAAPEDASDSGSREHFEALLERLNGSAGIIRFHEYGSAAEAKEAVSGGQADCAWIISGNYEEELESFILGNKSRTVTVIEPEENVFTRLAREKLYAAMYHDISLALFRSGAGQAGIEESEQDLMQYYQLSASDRKLVRFAVTDGSDAYMDTDARGSSLLLLPLRGVLMILILSACMAASVFCLKDKKSGSFIWIPAVRREFVAWEYSISAGILTGIVVVPSMILSGIFTDPAKELCMLALYILSASFMADILAKLIRNADLLCILIPAMIIVHLALCPVFLDFRALRNVQRFVPLYHYLQIMGSETVRYGAMILCSVIPAAIDMAVSLAGQRAA